MVDGVWPCFLSEGDVALAEKRKSGHRLDGDPRIGQVAALHGVLEEIAQRCEVGWMVGGVDVRLPVIQHGLPRTSSPSKCRNFAQKSK